MTSKALMSAALALLLSGLAPTRAAARSGPPVIPAPGQTVTWTLAQSPVTVDAQYTIPATGTVLVDPGVQIVFSASSRLYVDGTLVANGTAAQPVGISGTSSGWLECRGLVELNHCQVDNTISQGTNSIFHIKDSVLGPQSWTVTGMIRGPVVMIVERTTVQTPWYMASGEVLLRDVEFHGLTADLAGYVRTERVASFGTQVRFWRQHQPGLVDGLSVSGVAGAGLVLDGDTNLFIDPGVALTGNTYPVEMRGAGIVPGSTVPFTGNTNNAILGFEGNKVHKGTYTMPDLGLPYVFLEGPDFGGPLTVEPGVTIQFGRLGRILLYGDIFRMGQRFRGLPGRPIRLEALDPGTPWLALAGAGGNYLFEHLVVDEATLGISAPQSVIYLNECTVSNCVTGAEPSGLGTVIARGVQFQDNQVGARSDMSIVSSSGLDLTGWDRPNRFTGNALAVDKANLNSGVIRAEGNWWGAASGPFHASNNPTGTGDPVDFNVDFLPWLTVDPDLSDTPPVVRLKDPFFLADPGEPVLVQWQVSDDDAVVSQDVLLDLKGGGTFAFTPVVSGLPGNVTQYSFVMPAPGFNTAARPALLRVQATDSAGQTSFDEVSLHVTSAPYAGTFAFTSDLTGPYEPQQRFPICWSAFGVASGSLRTYLVLDADQRMVIGPAGNAGNSCTFSDLIIPYVSTDTARIAVVADANGNVDEWFFSEPFSIRPTALLGDAPPTVTMTAPSAGQVVPAGTNLTVAWTASDDEALRAFHVQATFNAGRTWHSLVRDLPASATSYTWPVPDGLDVADARVRVIAVDHRFQNSSDGDAVRFRIDGTPGPWTDLGNGLAGSVGVPQLVGTGSLQSGDPTTLTVSQGLPNSRAWLVVGLSEQSLPFRGGVMVPAFDFIFGGLKLDASGGTSLSSAWPAGVPTGFELWWQTWILDAGGPAGMAATNGLHCVTP